MPLTTTTNPTTITCSPLPAPFLPDEMLLMVAEQLNWKDLFSASQINQQWHDVSSTPRLWQRLLKRYFPDIEPADGQSHQSIFLAQVNELLMSAYIFNTLERASAAIKSDADIVKKVVAQNGFSLQFASEELKNNSDIVIKAVTRNGRALEYASKELRGDIDVVTAAITQNGRALFYASEELRGNIDVVTAAVTQNGYALFYASEELRGNIDVVTAAVKQNGWALFYASEELKGDIDVVTAAVKQNGGVLQYIDLSQFSGEIKQQLLAAK